MSMTFREMLLQTWEIDNIKLQQLLDETVDNFKWNAKMMAMWKKCNGENFYKDNYLYSVHLLHKLPLDKEIRAQECTTDNFIMEALIKFKNDFNNGIIMDYGSGYGNTGLYAYSLGYCVIMLDIDSPHARYLKNIVEYLNDRKLIFEFIEKYNFPHLFDIIVCNQVLEHVRTPLSLLRLFHKKLFANGRIICGVFFNDVQGLAPYHLCENNVFGDTKYWNRCLQAIGFEPEDLTGVWHKTFKVT